MRWTSRMCRCTPTPLMQRSRAFFRRARPPEHSGKRDSLKPSFPWRTKKFRTTIWKNTGIKRKARTLELSTGFGHRKIVLSLPHALQDVQRFVEVRLVFERKSRRYTWHIVLENGKQPQHRLGTNTVSVDAGRDSSCRHRGCHSATVITCRERRALQRGHAKNLKAFSKALARKHHRSRRQRKLMHAKARCKAKYALVMRDIEHKISHAIVAEAVNRQAAPSSMATSAPLQTASTRGKRTTNARASGTMAKCVPLLVQSPGGRHTPGPARRTLHQPNLSPMRPSA